MNDLKVGDIVARKSYGCDVLFKVEAIINNSLGRTVRLKGISYRLEADAPEWDLERQTGQNVVEYLSKDIEIIENINKKAIRL